MIKDEILFKAKISEIKLLDPIILDRKISDLTVREFLVLMKFIVEKQNPIFTKKSPTYKMIIYNKIKEKPNEYTQYKLSKLLNMDYNSVKSIVKTLINEGLVEVTIQDREKLLKPNPNGTTI
jgi:DNA-binding MarR family transcriptional regulator